MSRHGPCGGADFHCTPASGARFYPGAYPSFLNSLFLRDDDVFFHFFFCPEPPRCSEVCGVLHHFRFSAELLRCGYSEPGTSSSTSQAVVDEQSTRTVLENLADQLRSSIAPNQKALRYNSAADTPEIQPMVDTPTPAFPVTFKDFNGTEVTVKSADRVLALDLYGTLAQQMIALGLGGRLVGRVTSSTEQSLAHLPLVTQNGHDLNAEAILATSPDLVLWDKSNYRLRLWISCALRV